MMEETKIGWVIINIGHPASGSEFICGKTFSYKRSLAISKFTDGSGQKWKYWRDKYNFRAVKAQQTISTFNQ